MNDWKFTPGPWVIAHEINVVALNGRRVIAGTGSYQDNQRTELVLVENKANACLIAAAPELLAALEAARDWIEARLPDSTPIMRGGGQQKLDKIRAAIAKAKGEANG
jgi:hypothetical protein